MFNAYLCFIKSNNLKPSIMRIEMIIDIPDSEIVDALTTALEGGSNYWYFLPDLSMVKKLYHNKKEFSNLSMTEKVISAALLSPYSVQPIAIPVYDVEDEETKLGEISGVNIERGIKLFIADGHSWDAAMDADEADTLFQYIVMGEIVYG